MLIGRIAEATRISELLVGARQGSGGSIVIRGAPGIGKSALLAEARRAAEDMQVLEASGVESEAELPFASLVTLLRPLLRHLDRLAAGQRAALEVALALRPGGVPDRFGIGVATLSLLALAGEDRPVLAIVDDAHWLDAASADALLFAARRLGGDRVAMLFAAREGERSSFEATGVADLRLGGLGLRDAERLLADAFGRPVAPSVLRHMANATGGNPLALLELPSLTDPRRLEEELSGGPVPVGPHIKAAFSRQIAALPAKAQRALGLAAISETGSTAEVARLLDRLGLELSALIPAEVAELITLQGGRLAFRHPLLRAVAYDRLSAPDRRVGHLALAETLTSDSSRTRRAWHLAEAVVTPDEQIACELEAAAHESHRRGAPAAAAAALRAAARLTPSDEARVRRLIEAASEYHVAGRSGEAAGVLDDALVHTADPLVSADVEHLRARVQLLDASCVETHARLVAEADRVESLDPLRAAAMLVDASLVAVMRGRPREALELARRAHPAAGRAGGPLALAADYGLGAGLLLSGEADSAVPLLERAEALIDADDLGAAGHLAVAVAQCHNWHDAPARARDLLRKLVERGRRESVLTLLPYGLAALAEAEFRLGDWNAAYSAATESVSLAEEVGQRSELAHSLVRLAHVAAGRGSEQVARDHAGRALELSRQLGVGSIDLLAATALGLLELSLDRCDEAILQLDAARRGAIEGGLREPGVSAWAADLAEAHARKGDRAAAIATLGELEADARRTGRRSALAAVARVRGMLAAEADYPKLFDQALRWHETVPSPFEVARTRLCLGERLRRSGGRADDARETLRAALDDFETLGATQWAERARIELRATGAHARARFAPAAELTAQELQVAMLVIDGASNREAAAALFISPKTVEVHLTRIYRKLGVRSRTQLARELRASPSPDSRRFGRGFERGRAGGD